MYQRGGKFALAENTNTMASAQDLALAYAGVKTSRYIEISNRTTGDGGAGLVSPGPRTPMVCPTLSGVGKPAKAAEWRKRLRRSTD
jgi:hypothetical protein